MLFCRISVPAMRFSICAVSRRNRNHSATNVTLSSILRSGAFEDPDVTHVEGEVDPVRDLDIISEELRLKDVETLEKLLEKMERTIKNDKKLKPEYVSSHRLTT